jgi:phage-related protein
MKNQLPKFSAYFFATAAGKEPVRIWLKDLPDEDRKKIGFDISTAQYGWPLGMPLVKNLEPGIWEIRTSLNKKIARVLFTVDKKLIVLLHGFIKKSQKTPEPDKKLARKRMKEYYGGKK